MSVSRAVGPKGSIPWCTARTCTDVNSGLKEHILLCSLQNGYPCPICDMAVRLWWAIAKGYGMASNNEGYWSRSWALLTRDKGWYKPLLVLAAARMVPIVGPFGADGYALEWARLTSWGVDSSPKQRGVNVGGCIKSGARAFVVGLGYLLVYALLRMGVGLVLGEVLSGLFFAVLGVAVSVLIVVAKLRATIYQSIGAGYQVERIYDMVKYDYEGLLRIAGLSAIMGLVFGLVASVTMFAALLPHMGGVIRDLIEYEQYGMDDIYIVGSILGAIGAAMPSLFVLGYFLKILSSGISLVLNTAVGLWMRQFDVRNWGASSDPLPVAVSVSPEPYAPASPEPHAYGYQGPTVEEQVADEVPAPTDVQTMPEEQQPEEQMTPAASSPEWPDCMSQTAPVDSAPAEEDAETMDAPLAVDGAEPVDQVPTDETGEATDASLAVDEVVPSYEQLAEAAADMPAEEPETVETAASD